MGHTKLRILGASIALAAACSAPPPPIPAKGGATAPVAAAEKRDSVAAGRTWYMAPSGSCARGNGTLERPWCIDEALSSTRVGPGDTIYARLGAPYTLPRTLGLASPITATLKGSADRRITVRPYPPDQTTPTTLIRIACDQGEQAKPATCVDIRSNDVDYYEFEVAYFGDPRRMAVRDKRDLPDFGEGVRITADPKRAYGQGNRLINWVVHDTSNNVFKTDVANGTEFYGMVNYNYGSYFEVAGPPRIHRTGGHGFYLRNGFSADGSINGCTKGPDNSNPERSSIIDSIVGPRIEVPGQPGGSLAFQDYGTCGGCAMHRNWLFDGNFFLENTIAGGCSTANNYTLGPRDTTMTNNWWSFYQAGYAGSGCNALTLDGNFAFRAMYSPVDRYYKGRSPIYVRQSSRNRVNPCRVGMTVTNNVVWGKVNNVESGTTDDDINGFKSTWFPNNTYLDNDTIPSRNYTAVRPNAYRPGSCNVYVANFLNAPSVSVDLTTCGIADGASYEVRSIYDFMGAPVATGTFSAISPAVAFPMTRDANPVANSVGHLAGGDPGSYPDMAHSLTGPDGNIFRNAFVVLTTSAPAAPPASATPGVGPAR